MALNGQVVAPGPDAPPSPVDALVARLSEPRVAAAVHDLLDHADVVAFAVGALDGFLRRGEVIADSVGDALRDLRGASVNGPLAEARPALTALLPVVTDPATLRTVTRLAAALGEADRAPEPPRTGMRGLLTGLRDPDTLRGLHMLLQVAHALGRSLRSNPAGRPAPDQS